MTRADGPAEPGGPAHDGPRPHPTEAPTRRLRRPTGAPPRDAEARIIPPTEQGPPRTSPPSAPTERLPRPPRAGARPPSSRHAAPAPPPPAPPPPAPDAGAAPGELTDVGDSARITEATTRLAAVAGRAPGGAPARGRPAPLASWSLPGSLDETVLLPRPPLEQDVSAVPAPRGADARDDGALVRASGGMALATLVSRLTGFVRTLALAATVGLGLVGSSFQIANTLPNIIFELLLGGVLTSVVIPVLVRAAKDDGDGGDAFAQKLLSGASVALLVATVVAVVAAPLLVRPYIENPDNLALATDFAYLLLPQIFFYGIGALFGAILNARAVFGPAAWAPVLNNVVALVALAVYWLLPAPTDGSPVTTTQLLVVGIGSTVGIVLQAAVMLPAIRRTGFRWRWRLGWDPRLTEFGTLAAWVVGYVIISQIGLAAITRVAFSASDGGPAIYANAWLLIQVPYGVLGVSLLTALMPRMSAAAADGRIDQVVADLSLGSRLSTVALLPVSAVLTVFGSQLGVAMFSLGRGGDSAETLGAALSTSAFGLLPMAVVMLQLRVFYAMADARTPTLIMVGMTAVKIPLAYLCPVLLPPGQVVLGLAAVNSFGFVVGLVVGNVWLRHRIGALDGRRVAGTFLRVLLAAVVAVGLAWLAATGLERLLGAGTGAAARAWVDVGVGGVVSLVVLVVAMRVLRVPELEPVAARLSRLVGR